MTMLWPWAETHGCDALALSAGNVSRFFELQLVVVLSQLNVKAPPHLVVRPIPKYYITNTLYMLSILYNTYAPTAIYTI